MKQRDYTEETCTVTEMGPPQNAWPFVKCCQFDDVMGAQLTTHSIYIYSAKLIIFAGRYKVWIYVNMQIGELHIYHTDIL